MPEGTRRGWLFPAFLLSLGAYYWVLITYGHVTDLFTPEDTFPRLYDHMWENLVHGRFDVDRNQILGEAFFRQGKAYTGFGYLPVFLRGLVSPILDLHTHDISRLSCWLAALVLFFFAVRTARTLRLGENLPRVFPRLWILNAALATPCIFLLGPTDVFNEALFWGGAVLMAFVSVYCELAVRPNAWTRGKGMLLAALAIAAFLTRPPFGVATLVPLAALAPCLRRLSARVWMPAVAVLLAGFLFIGVVNFKRWGNPLVFQNGLLSAEVLSVPGEADKIRNSGQLSPRRAACALEYYFLPHADNFISRWPFVLPSVTNKACARLAYAGYSESFSQMPMPLTLPALLFLAVIGMGALVMRRAVPMPRPLLLPLLLGLSLPPLILLGYTSRCLRYQIYFLPLLLVLTVFGLREIGKRKFGAHLLSVLTLVSIFACGVTLLEQKFLGPAVAFPHRLRVGHDWFGIDDKNRRTLWLSRVGKNRYGERKTGSQ